jgi:hypothetical protein
MSKRMDSAGNVTTAQRRKSAKVKSRMITMHPGSQFMLQNGPHTY